MKYKWGIIVSVVLFLALLPLSIKVTFPQNDDWYYYEAVQNVYEGNFKLHKDVAPTLYLQVILGFVFSLASEISRLSILTLLISVASFYVFYVILKKYFFKSEITCLLGALVFFVNPLYVYGIFGFMTENYFIFFMLLSIFCFLNFYTTFKSKDFLLANILGILSFFVRQIGLFLPLSFCIFLLIKRKFKYSLYEFLIFGSNILFYFFIFPKTDEMVTKGLQFHHLLDFDYSFSTFWGSLIYFVAFSFPVIIFILVKYIFQKNIDIKKLLLTTMLSFGVIYGSAKLFKPNRLAWAEFPYFQNTMERKGYYPRFIHGTKYHFAGIHDLYYYLEIVSNVIIGIFASAIFVYPGLREIPANKKS